MSSGDMKFTVEIIAPDDFDFSALKGEAIAQVIGHSLEIRVDGPPAQFDGTPLRGEVIGASLSPRDRSIRLVARVVR